MQIPTHAEIVIIGGGVIGASIAYHLTKLGKKDVVLIERGQLTSERHGTPPAGDAAPHHPHYDRSVPLRHPALRFAGRRDRTGYRVPPNGSLPVARTPERLTEISRLVSLGKTFGVEAHMLSPAEVKERYPLLDTSRIVGGAFIPGDGQTNPIDTTQAFAKGARNGRRPDIFEGVNVIGFQRDKGAIRAVVTDQGTITCDYAVLCAGAWSRDLGKLAGVNVPLYAAEHMYVLTEPHDAVPKNLPVLRDTDGYVDIKEDAGKLLVGASSPRPVAAARTPSV